MGPSYGWWVGWIYGWALIITVASVDTGLVIYAGPLLNNIFHTTFNSADPNQILIFTIVLILIQLASTSAASTSSAASRRSACISRSSGRSASRSCWRSPVSTTGSATCSAPRARRRREQPPRRRLRRQLVARRGVRRDPRARVHLLRLRICGRRRRGSGPSVPARAARDHLAHCSPRGSRASCSSQRCSSPSHPARTG